MQDLTTTLDASQDAPLAKPLTTPVEHTTPTDHTTTQDAPLTTPLDASQDAPNERKGDYDVSH